MKTIAAIVPNYNGGPYIKRCLDSLLKQEYKLNEILIIDDCSNDDSVEIIEEYVKKNKIIKFIKNKENKGVSYSRNKGIEMCQSEYIIFCDSDDWYEKNATKELIEHLEEQNADFAFAGYYITYDNGKKIKINYDNFKNRNITKALCIQCMPITSSSKIMKKSIFLEHNLKYPENVKNCEELPVIPIAGFWANKVVYIDECLYNYYQRENSASNKVIKDLSFYDITYDKFKNNLPNQYEKDINVRMVEHLLYSKTYSLINGKYPRKEIIKNIEKCRKNLSKQDVKYVLKEFPMRKRIFIKCALYKIIFPLKLYVVLQQRIIGG